MELTIKNAKVVGDNGTFMRLRTDSNTNYVIDVDGLDIEGQGITGFDVSHQISLIEYLGLPKNTEPKEVIELLAQIQGTTPEESIEIVRKSTLLEKLGGASNLISIAANLLALTSNPSVQQLLASWSG